MTEPSYMIDGREVTHAEWLRLMLLIQHDEVEPHDAGEPLTEGVVEWPREDAAA